jgi:predicted outer membrane protein
LPTVALTLTSSASGPQADSPNNNAGDPARVAVKEARDRETTTGADATTTTDTEVRDCVVTMATHGIAEVDLGRLAAQRASNSEVKRFGQDMVTDLQGRGQQRPMAAQLASLARPHDDPQWARTAAQAPARTVLLQSCSHGQDVHEPVRWCGEFTLHKARAVASPRLKRACQASRVSFSMATPTVRNGWRCRDSTASVGTCYVAHDDGRGNDLLPFHLGTGVEIPNDPVRPLDVVDGGVPYVDFYDPHLGE